VHYSHISIEEGVTSIVVGHALAGEPVKTFFGARYRGAERRSFKTA
jgi:hypothetical protein